MERTARAGLDDARQSRTGWRDYVPAGVLFIASVFFITALSFQPSPGQPVLAAIFAPGTSSDTAFADVIKAGGMVLRTGLTDSILIARSNAPHFAQRLKAAGAWIVLDPVSSFGCLHSGRSAWQSPPPRK